MTRSAWAESSDAMRDYHDLEWGKPSHDERYLFELLTLEGAQAGLSWSTVLNKRENYRRAFAEFDVEKVAKFSDEKLATLLQDPGIVRNRLKVHSVVVNAHTFMAVQAEFGSFDAYLWDWVGNKPVTVRRKINDPLPPSTDLSDLVSKDLKKRSFKFVGTTIVYSYLQAVGVVDDHVVGCRKGR